jgi:hypothetical protein
VGGSGITGSNYTVQYSSIGESGTTVRPYAKFDATHHVDDVIQSIEITIEYSNQRTTQRQA